MDLWGYGLNSFLSAWVATGLVYFFGRRSEDRYRTFIKQYRLLAFFGLIFYVVFRSIWPYLRSGVQSPEGLIGGLVFGLTVLLAGWLLSYTLRARRSHDATGDHGRRR